jgi:hypothetical protein
MNHDAKGYTVACLNPAKRVHRDLEGQHRILPQFQVISDLGLGMHK